MVDDDRAALATVLVLQEMGLSVDVAGDPDAALSWARMASYEVVVCGGSRGVAWDEIARRLHSSVPKARIIVLTGHSNPLTELTDAGIDVLRPPINVNRLVERLAAV
jgi:DNA-binding response OmpR family regulator